MDDDREGLTDADREARWPSRSGAAHRLDVEWLAFKAGLKPAIRISCEPADAESVERRCRAGGASVRRATQSIEGRRLSVVYVAHSAKQAEELERIESGKRLRGWLPAQSGNHSRRLGRLLGYPACCAEAFHGRRHTRRLDDDWYRSACDAWVARPEPRLNVLLMAEGRSLLSFDPCRLDCIAALELADRVASAVRKVDAAWLAHTERQLALPIVVDAAGARAHVELDEAIPSGSARIVRAFAPVAPAGGSRERDLALAGRLPGSPLSPRGRVQWSSPGPEPLALDFSGR